MNISRLLIVLIVLVTVACAGPRSGEGGPKDNTYEGYTVNLEVVDGKLVVTSVAQGDDSSGKANGWVGFARGTHGTIEFALKDYKTRKKCTGNPADSAEWVLTTIALSKKGEVSTQKGERFGERQNGWIQNAFPGIDENGYLIRDMDLRRATASQVLVDLNNNNGNRIAYYEIEVRRCDGTGQPLKTDPGIGNKGK
jgi:hypothetical protein